MAKNPKVFVGDHGPVSVMQNGLQVAGAVKEPMTGEGHVGWDAPYKADIPGIKVYGKGRQKTLTGKNLFQPITMRHEAPYIESAYDPAIAKPIDGSSYFLSITPNGYWNPNTAHKVTIDYNSDTDEYFITISWNIYGIGFDYKVLPNTKYCVSYDTNAAYNILNVSFYGNDKKLISYTKPSSGATFVTPNNCEWVLIIFAPGTDYEGKTVAFNKITFSLSGPIEYEPYCGGIPAPNPEYPIEPEFLEMAEIACRGRNLFRFSDHNCSGSENGLNWSYDIISDTISIKGLSSSQVAYICIYSKYYNHVLPKPRPGQRFNYTVFGSLPKGIYFQFTYTGKDGRAHPIGWTYTNSINFVIPNDFVNLVQFMIGFNAGEYSVDASLRITFEHHTMPNEYSPFYDGGSTQLPILRALPDGSVRDEIDLETGKITRNIYEYIYTGKPGEANAFDADSGQYSQSCYMLSSVPSARSDLSIHNSVSNYFVSATYNTRHRIPANTYTVNGRIDLAYTNLHTGLGETSLPGWQKLLSDLYAKGTPVKVWYALETPIIEYVDPAILKQHPGYTQLIQQGGFEPTQIDVTPYTELAFPEKNSK